ncbi:MAG: Rho termination factor N-terminal domain-containing protein [Desulfuromonadales bacterium]|jgi:hypothetical protein|nr:Rho termination factor N-terminal domain-containing protein [Desulfuromonadales bacterium]
MKIPEIRERGRAMGITGLATMRKGEMIRAIQLAEGNRDCFGNLWRFDCLQFDCYWREDCLTRNPG